MILIKIQISVLAWQNSKYSATLSLYSHWNCTEQLSSIWRGQVVYSLPQISPLLLVKHMARFNNLLYLPDSHKHIWVFNPFYINLSVSLFTEISRRLGEQTNSLIIVFIVRKCHLLKIRAMPGHAVYFMLTTWHEIYALFLTKILGSSYSCSFL